MNVSTTGTVNRCAHELASAGGGAGAVAYGDGDVNCVGVDDSVQVPALLAHDVADLVDVHAWVAGRERDDGGRRISEHVELAIQLTLDPPRDLTCGADDGATRLEVSPARRSRLGGAT